MHCFCPIEAILWQRMRLSLGFSTLLALGHSYAQRVHAAREDETPAFVSPYDAALVRGDGELQQQDQADMVQL